MKVDMGKRFVIRADRRQQQPLPKHAALFPARPQISSMYHRQLIKLGHGEICDRRAHTRLHAENEASHMRHRATDAPRFHQYLAQERSRVPLREKCRRSVDIRRSIIAVAYPLHKSTR